MIGWCPAPEPATPTRLGRRDDAVIGAEHGSAEPADAVDEMGFGVNGRRFKRQGSLRQWAGLPR